MVLVLLWLLIFKENEIGEICISSYGIASEYIGCHKNLSEDSFIPFNNHIRPELDRIYRTGDYGKMINGRIYYEGSSLYTEIGFPQFKQNKYKFFAINNIFCY